MEDILDAIRKNDLSLVRSLLDSTKFDVNTPDPDKDNTPILHEAASLGHLDIVKLLVERGADVNNENRGGEAAIHFAAENKNWDVVRYLAEHGSLHVHDVEYLMPEGWCKGNEQSK